MNSRLRFTKKVLLIFVCAMSLSAVAQAYGPPGRLIVDRVPNFGWNLAFQLQIDGRPVATVAQGHKFDGWLPPGPHVLTVFKVPYVGYVQPISTTVNVEAGWTYLFTAMWDSGLIFLRPAGAILSPGLVWQLRP
jgi:hypothetical protein